jgi:hypothetical protein
VASVSKRIYLSVALLMVVSILLGVFGGQSVFASPSAGLYWGPVEVAGVKVYMTNPHDGYAGPKVGNANHINFHVDYRKNNAWKQLVNLHITRYTRNGKQCMYIWDSVPTKGRVVYDNCKDDWRTLTVEVKEEVRKYVRDKGNLNLTEAQILALAAIMVLAVVALIAVAATLPVLVLAAATVPDPSLAVQATHLLLFFLG